MPDGRASCRKPAGAGQPAGVAAPAQLVLRRHGPAHRRHRACRRAPSGSRERRRARVRRRPNRRPRTSSPTAGTAGQPHARGTPIAAAAHPESAAAAPAADHRHRDHGGRRAGRRGVRRRPTFDRPTAWAGPAAMPRRPPAQSTPPPRSRRDLKPVTRRDSLRAHIPPGFRRTCRSPRAHRPAILRGRLLAAVQCAPGQGRHLGGADPGVLLLLRLRRSRRRDHRVPRLLRTRRSAGRRLHADARRSWRTRATASAAPCAATPTARATGYSPGPLTSWPGGLGGRPEPCPYAELNRWWRHAGPVR